jgi:hypothetical protein
VEGCSISFLFRLSFSFIGRISQVYWYIHGLLWEQLSWSKAAYRTTFWATGAYRKAYINKLLETGSIFTIRKWFLVKYSFDFKNLQKIFVLLHYKFKKYCTCLLELRSRVSTAQLLLTAPKLILFPVMFVLYTAWQQYLIIELQNLLSLAAQ